MNDTICAISTAVGVGAISIVRVSGDEAISIVNKICDKDLTKKKSHTINYGHIVDGNEVIDEVMISIMKAPKTFTREDIVEINCHGGISSTNKILELLLNNGARLAEPGVTNGYSTLASEGNYKNTYLIRAVKNNKNHLLYEHRINKKKVLDNNFTFILSELLNNCYDNNLVDYSEPTCLTIRPKLTKKYAIKTGSTNTDSLIVGYNKDYTLGTWVGYDNNINLKKEDTKVARNIWADTIENYLRDKEDKWFDKPKDVNAVLVNPLNGYLATNNSKRKKFIYYLKGTEPKTIDK